MLKRLVSIVVMLMTVMSASLRAQETEDLLGVKDLNFNGTDYHLGWSAHNKLQIMQEYFPKGQNPDNFTDMFTIDVMKIDQISPRQAVEAKISELVKRKQTTKDVMDWEVFNNDDASEWGLDFTCSKANGESLEFVEYDVHRYRMIRYEGKPALQLIFYTHRESGDNITPFIKEKLAQFRKNAIEAITKLDVKVKE